MLMFLYVFLISFQNFNLKKEELRIIVITYTNMNYKIT